MSPEASITIQTEEFNTQAAGTLPPISLLPDPFHGRDHVKTLASSAPKTINTGSNKQEYH